MTKKLFFFILLLSLQTTFSQTKITEEYSNSNTPTYPGCENEKSTYKCYKENLGKLILSKLNNGKIKNVKRDTLILYMRTEIDGKTKILNLMGKNKDIIENSIKALNTITKLKPVYSKKKKRNEESITKFIFIFQKNKLSGLFEIVEK
jgi:hypothetical protein